MSSFYLKDLIGTKYYYVTFIKDLSYLIEEAQKIIQAPIHGINLKVKINKGAYVAPNDTQVEFLKAVAAEKEIPIIDVKGMYFSVDGSEDIRKKQLAGVKFIDSGNEKRNAVLNTANDIITETVPLPDFTEFKSIEDYIDSLSIDVVYTIQSNPTSMFTALLVILIDPDVQISLDSEEGYNLLGLINSRLSYANYMETKHFIGAIPIPREVKRTIDNVVVENGIATTTEGYTMHLSDAWTSMRLVPPTLFTNPNSIPEFDELAAACTNALNNIKKKRSTDMWENIQEALEIERTR